MPYSNRAEAGTKYAFFMLQEGFNISVTFGNQSGLLLKQN